MVAAAARPIVQALSADHPVVAITITQRQTLGQIVGVGGVDAAPHEQRHAGHETGDLGIIPATGVATVGVGRREPVGPIAWWCWGVGCALYTG